MNYFLYRLCFTILLLCSTTTYSADKFIVLLDWFANPDHAPLFVAQQQGFFKQQGLDVELIGPADPADPPKLVSAGKADVAITYEPKYLEQVDQGLPLAILGSLINKPLNCLVVLQTTSIKKISDLKGKTIGYSGGGVNNIALKVMLEKAKLSLLDVKTINIHYDLTQALLSGKVDAVTGMMRNFELAQLELVGRPGRAFYPEQNGMPNYSELIFVVHKQRRGDPRFKRFLNAVQQGVVYLKAHPEQSWETFAKSHPELNDQLNKQAWLSTLPYFANNPADVNWVEFKNFAGFMQGNGLIDTVKPLETYQAL